jgi:hypothetical protein
MELLKQMLKQRNVFVKSNEFQIQMKEVVAAEKSWEQVNQCKSIISLNNRLIGFIDKMIKDSGVDKDEVDEMQLIIDKEA